MIDLSALKQELIRARLFLIDPSQDGARERAHGASYFGLLKGISGVSGIASAAFGTFGFIASRTFPVIGGAVFIAGVLSTLASREVFVASKATEELLEGRDRFSNLVERTRIAASPSEFVNTVLKDSWIIEPFFGSTLKRELA